MGEVTVSTRAKSPPRAVAIAKALINRPCYSNGVLIDNWVEDRTECPKAGTLYFPPKEVIDYKKLKPESRQPDFRLNKLISTQILSGNHQSCMDIANLFLELNETNSLLPVTSRQGKRGNMPIVIRHDSHEGCGNYASVNDLVYNHMPRPYCGPIQRYYKRSAHQWYPQPDLMKCFGNVTEWGLRKYLLHEWKCTDVSDYQSSLYEETFVPPRPHQYLQPNERKARNSSFTKTFRFKMTKPKKQ